MKTWQIVLALRRARLERLHAAEGDDDQGARRWPRPGRHRDTSARGQRRRLGQGGDRQDDERRCQQDLSPIGSSQRPSVDFFLRPGGEAVEASVAPATIKIQKAGHVFLGPSGRRRRRQQDPGNRQRFGRVNTISPVAG